MYSDSILLFFSYDKAYNFYFTSDKVTMEVKVLEVVLPTILVKSSIKFYTQGDTEKEKGREREREGETINE